MDENGEARRVTHLGWEIRISLSPARTEAQMAGHADLWRDGVHRCRIALSGHFPSADSACDALERKSHDWIADWNTRKHSGDTGFSDL